MKIFTHSSIAYPVLSDTKAVHAKGLCWWSKVWGHCVFSFIKGMPLEVRVKRSLKLDPTKTWNMKLLSKTFKGWVQLSARLHFGSYSNLQKKKSICTQLISCLHQAKECWEMDLNEKLELAVEVKIKGNQYFKVLCFGKMMGFFLNIFD